MGVSDDRNAVKPEPLNWGFFFACAKGVEGEDGCVSSFPSNLSFGSMERLPKTEMTSRHPVS